MPHSKKQYNVIHIKRRTRIKRGKGLQNPAYWDLKLPIEALIAAVGTGKLSF